MIKWVWSYDDDKCHRSSVENYMDEAMPAECEHNSQDYQVVGVGQSKEDAVIGEDDEYCGECLYETIIQI